MMVNFAAKLAILMIGRPDWYVPVKRYKGLRRKLVYDKFHTGNC
jgi:hypothetical protein